MGLCCIGGTQCAVSAEPNVVCETLETRNTAPAAPDEIVRSELRQGWDDAMVAHKRSTEI